MTLTLLLSGGVEPIVSHLAAVSSCEVAVEAAAPTGYEASVSAIRAVTGFGEESVLTMKSLYSIFENAAFDAQMAAIHDMGTRAQSAMASKHMLADEIDSRMVALTSGFVEAVAHVAAKFGFESAQSAMVSKHMLADEVVSRISSTTGLSDEEVLSLLSSITDIRDYNLIVSSMPSLTQIGDPQPYFPGIDIPTPAGKPGALPVTGFWEVYFDGQPIKNRITGFRITYSEDYVHNQIEITSMDYGLFHVANPWTELEGHPRIEVHVGSRVIRFTLDDRKSSDEQHFTLSGFSPSVRNNLEFSPDWMPPAIEEDISASDLAETLIPHGEIIWDVPDWIIPANPELQDDPIENLTKIADTIKAIVRCDDDGSLRVRRIWPVRPCHVATQVHPSITYERQHMTSVSAERTKNTGKNAVEITNADQASSMTAPMMEIEEKSPVIGDTVHIRVYWEKGIPPDGPIEKYVTSGSISYMGSRVQTFPIKENEDDPDYEMITFTEGKASTSHPISRLVSIQWIGNKVRANGTVEYERHTKDLFLKNSSDDVLFGIAKVKYQSEYHLYQVASSIEEVLAVLEYYGGSLGPGGVSVFVRTADEDICEMDPISDAWISDEATAVERGTAEIDAAKYDRVKISFRAPYRDDCRDGEFVYVNDPLVEAVGIYKITSVSVAAEGPALWNDVEAERCLL